MILLTIGLVPICIWAFDSISGDRDEIRRVLEWDDYYKARAQSKARYEYEPGYVSKPRGKDPLEGYR